MNEIEQLKWSSFMPALLGCIASTSGPVLELGIGHFSTPSLHAICGAMKRKLVSIEENVDWFRKFENSMESDLHEITWTRRYEDAVYELSKKEWSVVFIDHSPGGQNRLNAFNTFRPKSDYVVVHDYELDNEDAIGPVLGIVKYVHITTTYEPPTLIASMTKSIPESILCL